MQLVNKSSGNLALNVVVSLGLVAVIVLNSVEDTRLGRGKGELSNKYVTLGAILLVCNILCMKMKHNMLKGLCVVVSLVLVNLAFNDFSIDDKTGESKSNVNRVVTLVVAFLQSVMCVTTACCAK